MEKFTSMFGKEELINKVWDSGLRYSCVKFQKGLTERKTKIIFNEGVLNLEYRNDNRIIMSGPVSKIVNLELEI